MACIFGHKWDGCKCSKCGKTRDELHNWQGCKCSRCGKTRNEEHQWQRVSGKCLMRCAICSAEKSMSHEWDGCICKNCGEVKSSTNPRLSSNLPLSSLKRIFIFTNGDGKTVLSCPVASGILMDTAGAPLNDFLGKVPFDVIARSNVGALITQTHQFPDSAWMAMSRIDAASTQLAQSGTYKSVIRTFDNPNTKESGACVLLYQLI